MSESVEECCSAEEAACYQRIGDACGCVRACVRACVRVYVCPSDNVCVCACVCVCPCLCCAHLVLCGML